MKYIITLSLSAAALVAAFNVSAVQQDITITAAIDPTVAITQSDNTPLPDSIAMQYLPGQGLQAHRSSIKLWSNTAGRNLNVSLATAPSLTDQAGNNAIPLSVSLNGQALNTTNTVFNYATTFPTGIANGSVVMPLIISQTTAGVASVAGNYSGIVSLVVTQATVSGS